jgi:hypothetical protein
MYSNGGKNEMYKPMTGSTPAKLAYAIPEPRNFDEKAESFLQHLEARA